MTSIRAEVAGSARHPVGRVALPASIDDAQEALIGCVELWRRSPGAGRWPFAGDGPWHLAQAEVGDVGAAEHSETIMVTERGRELRVRKLDTLAPRAPLDCAEVETRDRVTAWLQLLPDALDRRIVWLAVQALAQGQGRVPWGKMKARIRYDRTTAALAWRYRTALAGIVCAVNGWPMRRARALAQAGFARDEERD